MSINFVDQAKALTTTLHHQQNDAYISLLTLGTSTVTSVYWFICAEENDACWNFGWLLVMHIQIEIIIIIKKDKFNLPWASFKDRLKLKLLTIMLLLILSKQYVISLL